MPQLKRKRIGLTLSGQGGLNQPALFSDGYFFMKKEVWRSKISWIFLIHYELSEKQKKFWFFTVFCGDLEGAGWFGPPPLSSNIQEPRSIRVKSICDHWYLNPNPLTSLITVTPAICVFTSLYADSHYFVVNELLTLFEVGRGDMTYLKSKNFLFFTVILIV